MIKTGRIRNLLICTLTASMLLSSMTSAFGAEISIESEDGYAELSSIEEAEPYAELSSIEEDGYAELASLPTDEDGWYNDEGYAKRLASANNAADAFIKEFITDDMDEFEKAFYSFKWLSEYAGIKYSTWTASNTPFSYWYDKDTGLFLGFSYLTQAEYENNRAIEIANGRPDTYPAIGTPEFNEIYYLADGKVYTQVYNKNIYPSSEEERKVLEEYGTIYAGEAYSALIQKLTVCGGYADAYQLILKKLGINCKAVANLDHAWNEVIIKDCRFIVDPTNKVFGTEIPMNVGFLEPGYPLEWQTHTSDSDVYALHKKIYGTDMPKRYIFGRWWGGVRVYNTTVRKDLGNGNYIEVTSDIPYTGKKIKPYVLISYNGVQINSQDKKHGPKLKFKNNKNAGTATVTIKGVKGNNKSLSSTLKGQTVEFEISPLLVDGRDVSVQLKRKGGTVKSVKVKNPYESKPKYKKVKKNMWKVNGDNLEFSGNYEGSVSLNSI